MIDSFNEEYRFLSNLYPSSIVDDGIIYQTVEHAFQASKTLDREKRLAIAKLATPGRAKMAGQRLSIRPDWEAVKLTVMATMLEKKFRTPGFTEQLLDTGDEELVEGNTWCDKFWGCCDGEGENHLGRLLMDLRTQLREERNAGG